MKTSKNCKQLCFIICAFILLFQVGAQGAIQKEFWVSPSGNDVNAGTLAAPFKTITKARDAVRPYLSSMTGDIVVYLRAGDYFLSSTVMFNNSDSGTNGFTVIYKNWDTTGSARIILGTRLSGWKADPAASGVWTNSVATNLSFSSLFENERRGIPARYPNRNVIPSFPSSLGEYCIAKSGSSNYVQYFSGELNPGTWTETSNPKIFIWGGSGYQDWGLAGYNISNIDVTNRMISSSNSYAYVVNCGDRYYLEGVRQFLDVAGEFYYDKTSGSLRYIPFGGADPSTNIVLPGSASSVFRVEGSAIGTRVKNICFEGLYFWSAPAYAIYLNHTENIDIINCHFKFAGREAIAMYNDNRNNLVYGCWIEHCGYGGIFIFNTLNRTNYPSDKSTGHIIKNCKIHDLTEVTCNATENGGVTVWNADSCQVLNCEIFNATRYAISLRGHYSTESTPIDNGRHISVSNVFEDLTIYNVGSDSGDMGAIHAAAVNPTGSPYINYWRNIEVDHVTAHPSMQDIKPNGIFLDHPHSCENQSFQNIRIRYTQGVPYRDNNNPAQSFNNCSWIAGFNESLMSTNMGLKADFPSVYGASTTPQPTNEANYLRGETISDNGDAGYTEYGAWVDSTIGNTINGDSRYTVNSTPGAYAKWAPALPVAGRYGVYVWKFNNYSSLSAVNYLVKFSDGTLTNYVDGANAVTSSYWEKLGTYYFPEGSSSYVQAIGIPPSYVSNNAFRVDAVKFVCEHAVVPEGYWAFDEISGTTAGDSTLKNHDGALLGSPVPTRKAGRIGNCLEFNGTTGYVSVPDHSNLDMGTSDWAISVWFLRHTNAVTNQRLLSKGAQNDTDAGYAIFGSDTSISVIIGNGTSRISKAVNHPGVGKWNHLVVNMNRDGNMDIYLNGVSAGSVSISALNGSDIQNSWPLEIGRNIGANCYWDGEVDEVRIFRRTLMAEDIEALYQAK